MHFKVTFHRFPFCCPFPCPQIFCTWWGTGSGRSELRGSILSHWLGAYSRLWHRTVAYLLASLCSLASRYDKPMPESGEYRLIYLAGFTGIGWKGRITRLECVDAWSERGRAYTSVHPLLSASWAENTIITERSQESGHRQSMYTLWSLLETPPPPTSVSSHSFYVHVRHSQCINIKRQKLQKRGLPKETN
jgi:hypothetical protein